uniref:Uncharacterized protein n=1 Tax=Timema bartmani TaxID=61472 RepID=A0A7R9HZW7_9NEOP|nr:unnamed protein product [Timema bartmani]
MDTPALHLSNDRLSCMESSCSTITKFSVTRADQSSECSLINTAATSTKLHILTERLHLTATMNQIVIISCLLAAVLAAPPQVKYGPNEVIPILSQVNIVNEDGSFQNRFALVCHEVKLLEGVSDSTRAVTAAGLNLPVPLKNIGPQEDGQVAQGSYSFYTPDGQLIEVRYIADENGFQPQSNALPVGPPIPEEILKALAYNAAHPEEDNLRK